MQFVPRHFTPKKEELGTVVNIDSPVWGMSVAGPGVLVEGVAAIRQRIDLAIRTSKGTDPLRPEFGTIIYKYVDGTDNISIPNIKAEIIRALQMWVPEVSVVTIKHSFQDIHNPAFEITYNLKDSDLIDKLLFDLKNGSTISDAVNELILQGSFPDNPNNYRYIVSLIINGNQISPVPDNSGFTNIQELYNWVKANWYYIGRWYMLSDRIVCYINSEGIKTASLAINVLPVIKIASSFPLLGNNQVYGVQFKINGIDVNPAIPQTFTTPGDVLNFAQTYWNNLNWFIQSEGSDGGILSDEFSDEFEVNTIGFDLVGISNNKNFVGSLVITAIDEAPTQFVDQFSNEFK